MNFSFQSWTCKMMDYSVFSQTQPVFQNDPVKWLLLCRQQQYCMVLLYFLRTSCCSGSYALTVQRWSSILFSNTNGVCSVCWYYVRVVCTEFELWCWVHARWAPAPDMLCTLEWHWVVLFVKSLLLGASHVATWLTSTHSLSSRYVQALFHIHPNKLVLRI